MNRLTNKIVSIVTAITGFIFILYLAIMPTAMNRNFFNKIYDNESFEIYQKNNLSGLNYKVTMNKEDIKKALDHTLKFMLAEVDDLQIMVSFSDGSVKEFYEPHEISHMEDCQKLFVGGRNIAWTCFAITVLGIGFLILNRKNFDSKMIKYFFFGFAGIIALIAFVGIAVLIDFDAAFTALFGALAYKYFIKDLKLVPIPLIIAFILSFFLKQGTGITIPVCAIVSIVIAYLLLNREQKKVQ